MNNYTVLLLISAILVAFAISVFQYYYKTKRSKVNIFLAALRFISLLILFVLLVNPKYSKRTTSIEKANLLVLTDNSGSIVKLSGANDVLLGTQFISEDSKLSERFSTHQFTIADGLDIRDSLAFTATQTNLQEGLKELHQAYTGTQSAVVLFTDGNQNVGSDYQFETFSDNFKIFPVVVGDTTTYTDVRIANINSNKFAFLGNKFPVETTIVYSGSSTINATASISVNGSKVYQERITLNNQQNTKKLSTLIEAKSVGIKPITISVAALENEKNTINNHKTSYVEVIDERTKIGIVSNYKHPDIGALTKSISSNEQRDVQLLGATPTAEELEDMSLLVLFNPTRTQLPVINQIKNRGLSSFFILGPKTDWSFINELELGFTKEDLNQTEELLPVKNAGFSLFDSAAFTLEDYPPLAGNLGEVEITKEYDLISTQSIRGVNLNEPLFFAMKEPQKTAVLMGNDLWKWRMQSFRNTQNFDNFDQFIGKLIFYLANDKAKGRLQLTYDNTYTNAATAKLYATFYDNSFKLTTTKNLTIKVSGKDVDFEQSLPMIVSNGQYEVDLSHLPQGEFVFTVTEQEERISKSGMFRILDFDLEGQLLSADYKKLEQLASNTKGKLFYPNQLQELKQLLLTENQFTPIQKSRKNMVPLIDFQWLLGLLALSLAVEWFIRKYHGLL
ncbi:vWA domain-containing protein [Flavobacterium sp. ASW18X]|uniref:vWA domain-containing protein n=1 Tax=Flavobacterium sp. ASW18X TaxID=2572595 RepID=UPI0010AE65B0|nr:vWA domain-containing protein [Flavobacterium sp. ASW18X]TKD66118.1 VWA domain-containing protein [Flavobacterium sp. ASW18X]